jgi:hypothetical protein
VEGKALLETGELIFRGAECRVKITFGEMQGVTAAGGELRIKTKDREFAFAVGERRRNGARRFCIRRRG